MLKFTRKEDTVVITVTAGVFGYTFDFIHYCRKDYLAELMRKDYQDKMEKTLEKIRRDAYNKGWKDAKAKVKKETWFGGWW